MDRWKTGQMLECKKQVLIDHSQGHPLQFTIIVYTILDLSAARQSDWRGRAEHLEHQSF